MSSNRRTELFNRLNGGSRLQNKSDAVQMLQKKIEGLQYLYECQKQRNSQYLHLISLEIIALQQSQRDVLNSRTIAGVQSILIRAPSNPEVKIINSRGHEIVVETKELISRASDQERLNEYLESLRGTSTADKKYGVYFHEQYDGGGQFLSLDRLNNDIAHNGEQINQLNDLVSGATSTFSNSRIHSSSMGKSVPKIKSPQLCPLSSPSITATRQKQSYPVVSYDAKVSRQDRQSKTNQPTLQNASINQVIYNSPIQQQTSCLVTQRWQHRDQVAVQVVESIEPACCTVDADAQPPEEHSITHTGAVASAGPESSSNDFDEPSEVEQRSRGASAGQDGYNGFKFEFDF